MTIPAIRCYHAHWNFGLPILQRLLFLALSFVLTFWLRKHSFPEPLELDESSYMLMAKIWQDGGVPYQDLWDNKPPGTYLIYRMAILFWGYDDQAPRLLSLISMLLVSVLWAVLFWRRSMSSFLSVMALWPFLSVLVTCHANGANIEIFLLPLILGYVIFLTSYIKTGKASHWYAAVLIWTISVLVKQNMAPYILLVFVVLQKKDLKDFQSMGKRLGFILGLFLLSHMAAYASIGLSPFFFRNQYIENLESISPLPKLQI